MRVVIFRLIKFKVLQKDQPKNCFAARGRFWEGKRWAMFEHNGALQYNCNYKHKFAVVGLCKSLCLLSRIVVLP